jgi:lipopolysaccharide/colanic/teichoic acid biosynthesis glycosyltransferase
LKFTGEGEIFYIQMRVGKNKNLFRLYKFATMLKDSPNLGNGTLTVKNDPRVLPFGTVLRKTKINELPQLLNILFGQMSVIGPRPQVDRNFHLFPKEIQNTIASIKPGLSGIGSIVFRDEESLLDNAEVNRIEFYDNVIAPYKGKLELWFVENHTLANYFLLILLSVWVVLFPSSNIYKKIFTDLPKPPEELDV